MLTRVVLFGQGGHAKVVADAMQQTKSELVAVYDDHPQALSTAAFGDCRAELAPNTMVYGHSWHVAIGNNKARLGLIQRYYSALPQLVSVIHPLAAVSNLATIGQGCFIAAKAIIAVDTVVGQGCIINHGAVVDHDCQLDACVHIAPNATLGGNVSIGHASLIGAGAVILPGVKVGENVTVGAGTVVTADVPNNQTIVGVPGRCRAC